MAEDGDDNPGHSHPNYVPLSLCVESRAHMETKIDNMERSIRWSIYLASAVTGIVLILVQYYLAVIHVV